MTRIIVLTRSFPFPPGEQFIEPEAPFWQREGVEVVVMPWRIEGEARQLPPGVRVDDCLAAITAGQRRRARARCLVTPLFWGEVAWLARHRRLRRATLLEVVRAIGGAMVMRDALAGWIERYGPVDVAYGYWWDTWTYGAQMLRGRGIRRVVSRAHRYDLYEEMSASGYLALKRSMGRRLDALLPIARDGVRTAVEVYGLDPARVHLSPLGVRIPDVPCRTSPTGMLCVVSTSAMTPVKRVDRLLDALVALRQAHPELQVSWTHFGDGPLRGELEQRLASALGSHPAVGAGLDVHFAGNVANEELREHFRTHAVDVFVNTSESEGVPVSIMEAMGFGVPTLAPRVGGVGELVPADGPGGELLSEAPDGDEVARALWSWHERAKDPQERSAARRVVEKGYDESRNFAALMDFLTSL